MPSVGPGVQEIRVHTDMEHRVVYIAKFEEGVYIELARLRQREVIRQRRAQAAGRK